MNKIETAIERTKNRIKVLKNQQMCIEAQIEATEDILQILEMVKLNTSITN